MGGKGKEQQLQVVAHDSPVRGVAESSTGEARTLSDRLGSSVGSCALPFAVTVETKATTNRTRKGAGSMTNMLHDCLSYWAITWSHLVAWEAKRRICRMGRGRRTKQQMSHQKLSTLCFF